MKLSRLFAARRNRDAARENSGGEMLSEVFEALGEPWQEVTSGKFVAAAVGLLLLFLVLVFDKDGFIFLLDDANLVFHEAGHPIFGLFGETPGLYGGTIGQLVFPLVALAIFLMRREPVSFALAGVWLSENFLNIARYMADARAQVLPLVGGGEHDWTEIFSRWHVLAYDTRIAGFVTFVGWTGMIAMALWLAWRWQEDRR
ncbi:MAG TPA: hypothetical protein VES58_09935 [Syntrophobacteria bacterium]|nr:hypothetical protein [Syntrophobacteria bacterium]